MCGATAAQTNLQQQQAQFYQQMMQSYSTVFSEDQDLLGAVTSSMSPIIAAGVNQKGFSPAEETDLETQAKEGVAQGYDNAQTALNEKFAAMGGDASTTATSGGAKQISEELASQDVTTTSQDLQQILEANYATGRQNYFQAVGAEESAASLLNPEGYSGAATNAGSASGTTANQIAQANNSVWQSVVAGLGGIAGAAAGNLNVGPFKSSSSG